MKNIYKIETLCHHLYQKNELNQCSTPKLILERALTSKFSEFEDYVSYISDDSYFGTHQGIKGLEFERVMVILDDEKANGFLLSYEKLFGANDPTERDKQNQKEGKDSSIDRTRRLFYATCSRAGKSLAIIVYTDEPNRVRQQVLDKKWFSKDEIIVK